MKKTKGFTLIEILVAIAVLIITAGGVVVWKEKASPAVTPTPTPSIGKKPIPTPPSSETETLKMPWENSVCGNGVCEPCEGTCCQRCTEEACLNVCVGYCPKDCGGANRYPNPCPPGQAPVYEGGVFSNCVELSPVPSPTPATKKDCAVNGESPTNFDMTTGKIIPGGKPCCVGLKLINPKTPLENLNKGLCKHTMGTAGVCRPCGNGVCDTEYEDRCNCSEDCK